MPGTTFQSGKAKRVPERPLLDGQWFMSKATLHYHQRGGAKGHTHRTRMLWTAWETELAPAPCVSAGGLLHAARPLVREVKAIPGHKASSAVQGLWSLHSGPSRRTSSAVGVSRFHLLLALGTFGCDPASSLQERCGRELGLFVLSSGRDLTGQRRDAEVNFSEADTQSSF